MHLLQKKHLSPDNKGEKGKENGVGCILWGKLKRETMTEDWEGRGEINRMEVFQVRVWALCAAKYLSVVIMNPESEFFKDHYMLPVNGLFVEVNGGVGFILINISTRVPKQRPKRKDTFLSRRRAWGPEK